MLAMADERSMGLRRKINLSSFIENYYTDFLTYIENAEIMLKETIESIELIKEEMALKI